MIKHYFLPALTCVVFLFTCNQPLDNDSIFDPEYDGNYDLSVISPPFDTLLTKTEYCFTYTAGRDTFSTVTLVAPDTTIASIVSLTDSKIIVSFKKAWEGEIVFAGVRPNRKTVEDTLDMIVCDEQSYSVPEVYFSEKAYYISRNDSTAFFAIDSTESGIKYVWKFKDSEPDTTLTNTIQKRFAVQDSFYAFVAGIDSYGRTGDFDSVLVVVKSFEYHLNAVIPDTIKARYTASFKAVTKDSTRLEENGGEYCWRIITGKDTTDTSGISLSTFEITVHDSALMTVGVWVTDSLDSQSQKIQKPVVVREYRPVINFLKDKDTTRTGLPYTINVNVYDTDPLGGRIDTIFYDTNGDGAIDRECLDTSFTVNFSTGGKIFITAYAKDRDGFTSRTDTLKLFIRSDRPYFNPSARDTAIFVNTILPMKVYANLGETAVAIDKYIWNVKGKNTRKDTTSYDTLNICFTEPGIDTVIVSCVDLDGFECINPDTIIVTTDPGNPQVRGYSPNTVWIFDTTTYTVSAFDTNGTVEKYLISWEEDSAAITYSDSVVEHSYSSAGLKTVTVTVKDNDGYVSQEYTDTVIVKEGRPEANITVAESAWSYETVVCTVSGTDPNGTITKWAVSWDNGETFEISDKDSVFEKEFSNTGTVTVKCYVIDNDSLKSEIVSSELRIKYSHPSVKSIKSDIDLSSVYVNDMIRFTVKGTDPNGSIDSIKVSWDGKSSSLDMKKKAEKDSAVFTHAFSVSDTGKNKILFRVIDNDGLYRDSSITVEVKSGTPSVLSLYCERDTIWVNDTNKYRVKAQDPNGYIRKLYVNWEGGDEFEDSLLISGSRSSIDTFFTHFYDTTGGEKTVRVWAEDEDSLLSAVKDTVFTVRKGAPEVWGDSDDTLWVVVDDGYTRSGVEYYVKINAYDTNGTIINYYFANTPWPDSGTVSSINSIEHEVNSLNLHNGMTKYIHARDDDGFLRGGEFVVFPDSAPGEIVASYSDQHNRFQWSGMDKKDSLDTEYRILVKLGSSLEESDTTEEFIAKDWTRGNDPEFGYDNTGSNPLPF